MIMVSGASGQLGRRVVQLLLERVDAGQVVALSRTPDRIGVRGVASRVADFDDPDGLVGAFDGADRLLLISTKLTEPWGSRVVRHRNAIRAAAKAGVGQVFYTSISCAARPGHPAAVAAEHAATEAALAESGLAYTVLRHSQYAELILMSAPVALSTGLLLDNSGDGGISYVAREDCAAVAATVLATGGHPGEVLEVTGPEAVTLARVAALLTELTGFPVRYQSLSDDATIADLIVHGAPESMARALASHGRSTRAGYTNLVTDVVERIIGRPATSVAEFLAANLNVLRSA